MEVREEEGASMQELGSKDASFPESLLFKKFAPRG